MGIPTGGSHRPPSPQADGGGRQHVAPHAGLAESALVADPFGAHVQGAPASLTPLFADDAGLAQYFISSVLRGSRMGFIHTLAARRGLSEAAVRSVMASWMDSTAANYESTWNSFREYLSRSPLLAAPPDLATVVVNFLQDRFDAGLTADYVGNMRSSLSTALQLATGRTTLRILRVESDMSL